VCLCRVSKSKSRRLWHRRTRWQIDSLLTDGKADYGSEEIVFPPYVDKIIDVKMSDGKTAYLLIEEWKTASQEYTQGARLVEITKKGPRVMAAFWEHGEKKDIVLISDHYTSEKDSDGMDHVVACHSIEYHKKSRMLSLPIHGYYDDKLEVDEYKFDGKKFRYSRRKLVRKGNNE